MSRGNRGHEYLTDDEFRAWQGCLEATNSTLRETDERLVADHGISVKEYDVLITLYNAPDARLRMTELAERVMLTPSGVTHLVTRLERAGLIERVVDPDDRRSFFAVLTRAGDDRLREARPTHNEVIRSQLTARLSAAQLATMGRLFDRVLQR